jgi:hypothetical protein
MMSGERVSWTLAPMCKRVAYVAAWMGWDIQIIGGLLLNCMACLISTTIILIPEEMQTNEQFAGKSLILVYFCTGAWMSY